MMWVSAEGTTRRRLLQDAAAAAAAAAGGGNGTTTGVGVSDVASGSAQPPASHPQSNVTTAVRNVIDDDFTDMETLVLTCITTLVTLVFALIAGFCVRFLWRKLRDRSTAPGYEGVLQREESSDPLAVKSLSASGNLLTDEVRLEEGTGAKTTTTKFSASASPHQNGVFVVEVQQGGVAAATSPAAGATPSYAASTALYPGMPAAAAAAGANLTAGAAQHAQVHRPPDIEIEDVDDIADIDDIDDEDEEDDEDTTRRVGSNAEGGQRRFGSTNTGLSQSDLSMSSAGSNNPSYRYGNQVGYESGQFGYPQYSGYSVGDECAPLTAVSPSDGPLHSMYKPPAATHAPGLAGRAPSVDHTLAYGPLMSDSLAAQRGTDAPKPSGEDDVHQEEQRKLGNGTAKDDSASGGLQRKGSLPPRLAGSPASPAATKVTPEDVEDPEEARDAAPAHLAAVAETDDKKDGALRGKRASLPIITPDLYKQTKNLILDKTPKTRASLSPKFERLKNEVSPLEEVDKCPPEDGAGAGTNATASGENPATGKTEYENKAFVAADQATS